MGFNSKLSSKNNIDNFISVTSLVAKIKYLLPSSFRYVDSEISKVKT